MTSSECKFRRGRPRFKTLPASWLRSRERPTSVTWPAGADEVRSAPGSSQRACSAGSGHVAFLHASRRWQALFDLLSGPNLFWNAQLLLCLFLTAPLRHIIHRASSSPVTGFSPVARSAFPELGVPFSGRIPFHETARPHFVCSFIGRWTFIQVVSTFWLL